MRIPPAIAREIGQMYARANANDAAARTFDAASATLNSALYNVIGGKLQAAAADATTAASLLRPIAADPQLTGPVREIATSAAARAAEAAATLLRPDTVGVALPLSLLQSAQALTHEGSAAASSTAAAERHSAEQLANEYLFGPQVA